MTTLISRLRARRQARRIQSWQPGRVWDIAQHRGGWGDRISWSDYQSGQLSGHTTPRPRIDDEMRATMQSGRVGRFRVVNVEYCGDPSDMWFATVEPVGYLDEFPAAPPVTSRSVFA